MSSSSPIEMEESSDTSHEDRIQKSRNPHDRQNVNKIGPRRPSSRLFTNEVPSPPLSYSAPPAGLYIGGSPYSTSSTLREQPLSSSIPACSMWGSDSSQLYRPASGAKDVNDKKQVCSTLLITTATLIVLAILAVAAFAAYLGVMTNHSDSDKYEIQFDGSMRITHGDNFRTSLSDSSSPQFRAKSDHYRRLIDSVYKASSLSDSFRRSSVERFTNDGSLIVHFRLFFDRRKIPDQIGETGSSVQDVLVQEVIAVQPVALAKTVIVDIDSITVKRYIPSGPSLGHGQRSRLIQSNTGLDYPDDDEQQHVSSEVKNSLEYEPIWSIVDEEKNHNMNGEVVTIPTSIVQSTNGSSYYHVTNSPGNVSANDSTVMSQGNATPGNHSQRPSAAYDDSEWKPIIVNNVHRSSILTMPLNTSHASTNAATLTPSPEQYEKTNNESGELPPDLKTHRIIETQGEEDNITNFPVPADEAKSTPAPPRNKLNFLQWFNSQLHNSKLHNQTASPSSSPSAASPLPPVTRFFTLKPTAISYSGVQPVMRPKPLAKGENVTEQEPSKFDGIVIPTSDSPLVKDVFLPRPFQVQTTLNLHKEPLIESPRSGKAILNQKDSVVIPAGTGDGIAKRELHPQQVEMLHDFFPPVRRPVSRPQVPSKVVELGRQQDARLPIESLFAHNNQTRSNSPIYTFKLNQGQTVHEVLTRLLADLTISDSPANIEVDGSSPEMTVGQQQSDNLKKASNKKVDDDRLRPWSQVPFRPTIFNSLYQASRYNNSEVDSNSNKTGSSSSTMATGAVENTSINTTEILTTNQDSNSSTSHQASKGGSDCADQFRCMDGECVSQLARCNAMRDCRDGSDEVNCTCADFLRAQFLGRKICDGVVDCWDYSDENQCEWCKPGQYVCPNSKVCIDQRAVCDGIPDCPVGGEDERNCVALAHHVDANEEVTYSSSGYLMVRREGRWGKLCMQNFETAVEKLRQSFQVNDLGKAVCKELTFNALDKVEKKTDSARSNSDEAYYEIVESSDVQEKDTLTAASNSTAAVELLDDEGDLLTESPRASTLDYTTSTCPKRQVIHIQCRDLECGIRPRSTFTRARIVGGANSTPGAWPWQAALYKEGDFQCGATLINDRWLVSAGHCFYHSLDDHWVARLGALRRGSNLLSPHEQVRVISHIFIHPGYIDTGFVNDISVLRMEDPVRFTDYIRPVCLPPPNAEIRDGRLCTVIGWGQLYETGRVFPDTLQQVQLPLVSTEECRKRTLFLPLYRLTNNMFCAGFDRGGRDACLGDSGGPLVCEEADGRWSLQGVTSNGYGCARANRPGVYTKVARYVGWINQVVNGTYRSPRRPSQCINGHRCALGACLPLSHVCNGITECQSDNSDEKNCAPVP